MKRPKGSIRTHVRDRAVFFVVSSVVKPAFIICLDFLFDCVQDEIVEFRQFQFDVNDSTCFRWAVVAANNADFDHFLMPHTGWHASQFELTLGNAPLSL